LIDTGANSSCYISKDLFDQLSLPEIAYDSQVQATNWLGRTDQVEIRSFATPQITLEGHHSQIHATIVPFCNTEYDLIVGKLFLRTHGAIINCATETIIWECQNGCKGSSYKPAPHSARVVPEPLPTPIRILQRPIQPAPPLLPPKKALKINLIRISSVQFSQFKTLSKKNPTAAAILVPKPAGKEQKIPSWLAGYEDVFSNDIANALPPRRPGVDFEIHFLPGESIGNLSKAGQWRQTDEELAAVREYLEKHLASGFIARSEAPFASPILFVKKKDGSLRLCVDYRRLNRLTLRDAYPLPRIDELLDRLSKAKVLTKLDIKQAFHRIRMAPKSEDLTTFTTRYGLFKYRVLPFGLANGPAAWQRFINGVLGLDTLDQYATAYMDDLLIFSERPEQHHAQVKGVLDKLRAADLTIDLEKCEFETQETLYLGIVVSTTGIKVDPSKIAALKDWPTPRNATEVRSFLGFCSFYRRFIQGFSKIATPLYNLTRKEQEETWTWDAPHQQAFDVLRKALYSAPTLAHFDRSKPAILECDASDTAIGGILSQKDNQGRLHPVAFFSKKMLPAEQNYDIYDKELLAIVRCLEEWRADVQGTSHGLPIEILTDHQTLQYFTTSKKLSRRQARWAEKLADYHFEVRYRPGKQNEKADILSRIQQPGIQPKDQQGIIIPPERFVGTTIAVVDPPTLSPPLTPTLEQIQLMKIVHEEPASNHPGVRRMEYLLRDRRWPTIRKDLERYVRNCATCRRIKSSTQKPQGLLHPLPIPTRRWQDISCDFVTGLPLSRGHTAILTVVDRLTKMRHFIPCTDKVTAKDTAQLFLDHVWKLHGLPDTVTSDRGPQFVSELWNEICKRLQIKVKLSTGYHPQTNGQSENGNKQIEQFLRGYVNYYQDDWASWLAVGEFALNRGLSTATGMAPFFANYGWFPRLSFDTVTETHQELAQDDFVERLREINEFCRHSIEKTQQAQIQQANRHRRPAQMKVGDRVFLSTKNIRTERPSRKLENKWIGPFDVKEQAGNDAFRLALPATMKIHPEFHSSFLQRAAGDPYKGQQQSEQGPIIVNDQEEWELEEILAARLSKGQLQYRVKWIGFDEDYTWYPAENFENAREAIEAFHTAHPTAPIAKGKRERKRSRQ
jgi:transposase InsO family protein